MLDWQALPLDVYQCNSRVVQATPIVPDRSLAVPFVNTRDEI